MAKEWARDFLTPGTCIALHGNLGSGKTTFIKGVALGLGLKNEDKVKSPTFVLMHIYPTRIPLYHFDLYRLDSPDELFAIGFEDFVQSPSSICCVEWAEKAGDLMPEKSLHIEFSVLTSSARRIVIHPA